MLAELVDLAQGTTTEQSVADALGVFQTIFEYAGTVAFAISGALVAGQKRMDVAGVVVLGAIVAVGGGTTRDLLLGQVPVFWVNDPTFVVVGVLAALATIPLAKTGTLRTMQKYNLVDVSDAAGLSLFVITGTNVALAAGAADLPAAIVGVISGVGGGIIRDVLANEVPGVLRSGHLYATAAFAGSVLYVLLLEAAVAPLVAVWAPILTIFGLRMLSLRYGWGVPKIDLSE
jgi:uncharacterized membrane protein YeiH